MSKRVSKKVRFDDEEEKQPTCQECEASHSQFFKCPHYKGNTKRAEKLCEKLRKKLGQPGLKFEKESDILSFKPEHVFTIEGLLDKKIVSPFTGKLVKSDQWKQVLSALKQYRGLTWTSPGVQEALFIQFGEKGVLENKKLFIDKLNQMLKHTRHHGGEYISHNNYLDQIMNEIKDEEEMGDTPEQKITNIVDMVQNVSFDVQQNRALYDETVEYINENLDSLKENIHGKYGLHKLHREFETRMINTTDDLRNSATKLKTDQIEMNTSLKNLEAKHEDLSTRHDGFVKKAQDMSDTFEEFKANSERVFKKAMKARDCAKFVQKCFDNFMRVDRQREREMQAMKHRMKVLEQKVFCLESGFDMKSFVDELVDSVADGKPYILTGEILDCLD